MSARDVSAHYSAGEGLTALLGGMEHATLESISIENSATHTHTHRQEQGGGGCGGGGGGLYTTWSVPTAVFSQNYILKGRADAAARTIIHVSEVFKGAGKWNGRLGGQSGNCGSH